MGTTGHRPGCRSPPGGRMAPERPEGAETPRTVAQLGEFALIDWLAAALAEVGAATAPDLLGIGDDAAIWTPTPGTRAVITTDSLIAGVHFRLDWTSWRDLGH